MKISIVVGYATEHEEIIKYLQTLETYMREEPEYEYEVIVVSDMEWSKELDHPIITKQLFLDIRGFGRVFNEGVRHTTGEYIVISNCDQRMRSPWSRRCVQALQESKAWMAHVQPNLAEIFQTPLYTVRTQGLPAFFWVIPREYWLEFDEEYSKAGGYHDDHDYCERIKRGGGHYIDVTGINLYHTSNGHLQKQSQRTAMRQQNADLFRKKWGKESNT